MDAMQQDQEAPQPPPQGAPEAPMITPQAMMEQMNHMANILQEMKNQMVSLQLENHQLQEKMAIESVGGLSGGNKHSKIKSPDLASGHNIQNPQAS